jgi:hypothetical protein
MDGGDPPEPDAGHDSGDPGCDPDIPCVCGHDRLEPPSDPCAADECPIEDCAPDPDCQLERLGNSVYYFCEDPQTQPEAVEHCAGVDGMHLVIIDDAEEDAFVLDHIDSKVWIGASRESGIWSWHDGTEFFDTEDDQAIGGAYTNWDEVEPNNTGVGPGETNCAIYWFEESSWADTNCPANNDYVCERELE